MIQIFISFVLLFALLICVTTIYYRWAAKPIYLFLLILGLSIVNISSTGDYQYILTSIVLIGATAGFSFRLNKSLHFYIVVSSISLTLIFSANHYYFKTYKNIDILSNSREKFIGLINKTSNMTKAEKKELLKKIDDSIYVIRDIIPFTYFLNSFMLSIFCFYFVKYIFSKSFFKGLDHTEGIELFRLKEYLIFILIIAWSIVLLVERKEYYLLFTFGLNVALVLSVLYFIQSLGVIKFFLTKKGLPVLILPLVFFIIFLLGIEYILFMLIILSSIGALDFWADFRKLDPKVDNKNNKKQ